MQEKLENNFLSNMLIKKRSPQVHLHTKKKFQLGKDPKERESGRSKELREL